MEILKEGVHYFLHFVFPAGIAFMFFRSRWKKIYLLFLLTMLVDLDHLLATPLYDACRCGIGFHPLHSYPAILVYGIMLWYPKVRVIAIGLLVHMVTDSIDCLFIRVICA
jgi:hypothetical protein